MKPIKTNDPQRGTVSRHPAFGILKMSVTQSNGTTLFGSNLSHQHYMHFQLAIGEETRRSESEVYYSKTYEKGSQPVIADFSMTMSQFVNLITTPNTGTGVPCTLSYYNTGDMVNAPKIDISEAEDITSRIKNDVKQSAKNEAKVFNDALNQLGELVAKGKAGKKELTELYNTLQNRVNNLPENLAFSVTLAEEAVDKMVTQGKTEIEATIMNAIKQLGVQSLSEGKQITLKTTDD